MKPEHASETLQALRQAKSKSGKLLRVDDLVFDSALDEQEIDATPRVQSVYDANTERAIRNAARTIHPQAREAILSGLYRMSVTSAAKVYGVDDDAIESLQVEVVAVLLGLQTVPEFEQAMRTHAVLSAEEGTEFAQEIRRTLFAELALYLEGMGDTASTSAETLSTAIQNSPDVQARLAKLPESVQTVVSSQQLEDAFASIQKRHHIETPTAKALAGQVLRVMVGLSNMNDFKVSVTRVAGIPPSGLDALFLDVEQGLFKPVRTAILNALQKNMGSLPAKEGTQSNDPYRTPAR